MSALPNPLSKPPSSRRKPAQSAADPERNKSALDKLRVSDYDADTGYAPLYFSLLADLPRLTSGGACTLLILAILAKSYGRHRKTAKEPRHEWTLPFPATVWAEHCNCDVRTIEREIAGLERRHLAEIKREGRGGIAIRLRLREWPMLTDYKSNVVDIETGQEPDEEEAKEEQEAKPNIPIYVTKRPAAALAGCLSRKFPVKCDVASIQFKNDSVVDLKFSAVVQAGELILTSQVPDAWIKKAIKHATCQTNETSKIEKSSATPMSHNNKATEPGNQPNTPTRHKETKGESEVFHVKHARADELSNLFDPILMQSHARLLSADPIALSEACEAVQTTDHHYLVRFVLDRAGRGPIKSPKHCKQIVIEARENWQRVKDLPVGQQVPPARRPPTTSRPGLVERALEESKRRIAKYGKL